MIRINCKHVTQAGAPSRGVVASIVHVRVVDGAPPTVEARREHIEVEAFLCPICTAAARVFLDSTMATGSGDA